MSQRDLITASLLIYLSPLLLACMIGIVAENRKLARRIWRFLERRII